MEHVKSYNLWLEKLGDNPRFTEEFLRLQHNNDEIYDSFYKSLNFGTGGLRGKMGIGTNRMNVYTVGQATQGLANHLLEHNKSTAIKVAIAYDSRNYSDLFARVTATVLAANGITVYMYDELMPTPMLSFAVRHHGCQAGVVITASHNPKEYNGYKVYGSDGAQLTAEMSDGVLTEITAVDLFNDVKNMSLPRALSKGLVHLMGEDTVDAYLDILEKNAPEPDILREQPIKVVYTPLNGSGNRPVRSILHRMGVSDLTPVAEQELPNGDFPTCPYPNPEDKNALELGLKLSQELGADLLIATDPDSDRTAIAVRHKSDYRILSGDEMGVMFLDYLLCVMTEKGTQPKDGICVKTIVSTPMTDRVAESHGVKFIDVLPGFKNIGEQIALLEEKDETDRFIFGFEESYGYLAGCYIREKDGVQAALLAAQMTAHHKKKGKTVIDRLKELQDLHGYYYSTVKTETFEGAEGAKTMADIMQAIGTNPPKHIDDCKVLSTENYMTGKLITPESMAALPYPTAPIITFKLDGGHRVIIRPSGTEPKLKMYFTAVADSIENSMAVAEGLVQSLRDIIFKG